MRFFNSTQTNMSFGDVIASIKYFVKSNPDSKFKITVGSHSQVKGRATCFATGIHIHKVGYGAWCCIHKRIDPRRFTNLKEKIMMETIKTYEIISMLNEQLMDSLSYLSLEYKNFECVMEAHIDIGRQGETRKLIREMVGYFDGIGIGARIKPDSFVASTYANRHSKSVNLPWNEDKDSKKVC